MVARRSVANCLIPLVGPVIGSQPSTVRVLYSYTPKGFFFRPAALLFYRLSGKIACGETSDEETRAIREFL